VIHIIVPSPLPIRFPIEKDESQKYNTLDLSQKNQDFGFVVSSPFDTPNYYNNNKMVIYHILIKKWSFFEEYWL